MQDVLQRVSGWGLGGGVAYRELLCNVVNKHQTAVSFSISQRGILFPPEMGTDVKAISVSRFTVTSLGPDVCTLLVPCSENICELFPLLPVPPPAKKTQNITVKRTYYSLNNRQKACSLEIEKAASEVGEGR